MKRLFSLLLAVFLVAGMVVPVFATEPPEGENQPPETQTQTEGTSTPESSEGGSEEGSEEGSEPSGTAPIVLDGATVNVSDESISAIANAVVNASASDYQYAFQYNLTFSDGRSFVIDTDVPNLFDYPFLITTKTGYNSPGSIVIGTDGNPVHFKDYTSTWGYVAANSGKRMDGSTSLISFSSFDDLSSVNANTTKGFMAIYWSNYDVLDSKTGEVIHSSDVEVSYNISFNTGFDDLVLDSQSSQNFVAPTPSYDGYKFDGWYFDSNYTTPYVAGYEFTSDTTLYAKWLPYRTVSFVTGIDGFELDSVKVVSGEAYTPPVFSYAGYTFVGAYTDKLFENQFVGGTVVDGDLTLYLRFEKIVYDFGALMQQQLDRMETIIYILMAQGVILSVSLVGFFFFRQRTMGI